MSSQAGGQFCVGSQDLLGVVMSSQAGGQVCVGSDILR